MSNSAITRRECDAMRLLKRDGWTVGELRMTFHLSTTTGIRRHLGGVCEHDNNVEPINVSELDK